jgi:3-methyl-2-oxobutanoate hydroxymethyltransferase
LEKIWKGEQKMHKSIKDITEMKGKEKITVLTGYDSTMVTLCEQVDVILVGDSAGMVMLGYEDTTLVTMDDMIRFTTATKNGRKNSLIVSDLPINSYQTKKDAVTNSLKLIQAGADAVKLEGGKEVAEVIRAITESGIPVMGHLGLLPQTAEKYTVQGKTRENAIQLIEDAKIITESGVFSIVLEMVTSQVAKIITEKSSVPTIGIGSGKDCDGQVLVVHDMLGLFEKIKPKFAKRYLDLSEEIRNAVKSYVTEVKEEKFPADNNEFQMDETEYKKLRKEIV